MVSKHHYALELARRGNTVYFLNPPNLGKKYFEKEQLESNLYLINYRPIFRAKKLLPSFLFNFLIWIQVRYFRLKVKTTLDLVFSFDSSIYMNLEWFNAKTKIYFIADNNESKGHIKITKNADLVLSVSQSLLDEISIGEKKSHFINHGLSNAFAEVARKKLKNLTEYIENLHKIRVCYIGNLLIKSFDREVCKNIVSSNRQIKFTFYGAYQFNESNLSGYHSNETKELIEFLKKQENVELKGSVYPSVLANEIRDYDAFLILVNPENDYNSGANSHKAIEYLSTGKVVIANHLSTYKGKIGLIEMVDEMHNDKLPELFRKVIENLEYYNREELRKKRIEYALNNTYEKQIERIEVLINRQNQK